MRSLFLRGLGENCILHARRASFRDLRLEALVQSCFASAALGCRCNVHRVSFCDSNAEHRRRHQITLRATQTGDLGHQWLRRACLQVLSKVPGFVPTMPQVPRCGPTPHQGGSWCLLSADAWLRSRNDGAVECFCANSAAPNRKFLRGPSVRPFDEKFGTIRFGFF